MMRFGRVSAVFTLWAGVLAIALFGGAHAWSSEGMALQPPSLPQAAVADDSCRPFLLLRQEGPALSKEQHREQSGIQKAGLTSTGGAGAIAAALLFGARSAIGPREGTAAHMAFAAGADGARARAVARYRACRSERALQTLASR